MYVAIWSLGEYVGVGFGAGLTRFNSFYKLHGKATISKLS